MQDEVAEVRERAAWALGALGSAALPALLQLIPALEDPCPAVRREAAGALWGMGRAGLAGIAALADQLRDPVAQVRQWAAAALGDLAPDEPLVSAALVVASQDADEWVRETATRALAKTPSPSSAVITAVVQRLQDESPFVRRTAAEGPGQGSLTRDLVRSGVANIDLELIQPTHPTEHLPSRVPRLGAREAIPHLLAALGEPIPWVCRTIIQALASLQPALTEALGPLTSCCQHPDVYVREAALHALGQIANGDPRVVPLLVAGLQDPFLLVRMAAVAASGNVGPAAAEVLPLLVEMLEALPARLAAQPRWYHPEIAALPACLEKMGPAAAVAVPQLLRLCSCCQVFDHPPILEALGAIGDRSAAVLACLEQAAQRPEQHIREVAIAVQKRLRD